MIQNIAGSMKQDFGSPSHSGSFTDWTAVLVSLDGELEPLAELAAVSAFWKRK